MAGAGALRFAGRRRHISLVVLIAVALSAGVAAPAAAGALVDHPLRDVSYSSATPLIDTVARGLPAAWDASGSRIVATLDETTYKPDGYGGMNLRMGDHPIAWTRCIGRGRMFYSAIGHRPERYADALHMPMLGQAVGWVGTRDAKGCKTPE